MSRRKSGKALILDMDGVIVDTEPIHVDSFRVFLKRRAITASERFLLDLIGHSVEENMREIYRTFFAGAVTNIEKDVREREDIYLALLKQSDIQAKAGLMALIAFCEKEGITLGLASSSIREQITAVLEKLSVPQAGSLDYYQVFKVIVSGEDVARKKPLPDIYLMALQQLDLPRSECLAVEDSPAGIQAAKAAGIRCAAVRTDYIATERLKIADAVLNSLEDLPVYLKKSGFISQGE